MSTSTSINQDGNGGITINVSGECTIYKPAERCEVQVRVSHEGEAQHECIAAVTSLTNELSSHLKSLSARNETSNTTSNYDEAAAPITWWSLSRLQSQNWIPPSFTTVNVQGGNTAQQEPTAPEKRRYRSTTQFRIKFRDFSVLSQVIGDMARQPDIHVDGMTWLLTDKTRDSLKTAVRQGALRDAVAKASDYAVVYFPEDAAPASAASSATGKALLGHSKLRCTDINDGHIGISTRAMHNQLASIPFQSAGPGAAMPRSRLTKAGVAMQQQQQRMPSAFGFAAPQGGSQEAGEVIDFEPEEVGVSANVSCTFTVAG